MAFMRSPLLPTSAGSEQVPLSSCTRQTIAPISPYGLPEGDQCVSSVLRANGLSPLCDASLAELDRIAPTTSFPEAAVLFVEGEVARGVYVLCRGYVKLTTTSQDGKTLIMRIAQPGETLGLHSVVTGKPYEVTVETLQPCQLAFLSRADFLRLIRERADACLHMAQQLSNECQSAYEALRLVGARSVSEKVARLLLQWSGNRQLVDGPLLLRIPLTHEEMGQLIGTSRETVTRTLSELKKRRVLKLTASTLLILDRAALQRLARA